MSTGVERWLALLSPPATSIWVASRMPDKLAGVREGFDRLLRERFPHDEVRVVVTPATTDAGLAGHPLTDTAVLDAAIGAARALEVRSAGGFAVATETGPVSVRARGKRRVVLRTWAVVRALGEEAWGSGGSVQLPSPALDRTDAGATRRHGGMVADLTDGHENRRTATALATYLALSSLLRCAP